MLVKNPLHDGSGWATKRDVHVAEMPERTHSARFCTTLPRRRAFSRRSRCSVWEATTSGVW
eukprot:1003812-Lingulodinium_polyedra.AAC.1